MKKLILIICLLAFTGTAYAESNYVRKSSPLSVGETDKYFKDLNSWDSRNLYVPGQPYSYTGHDNYGYTNTSSQVQSSDGTTKIEYNPNGPTRTYPVSNVNSQGFKVTDGDIEQTDVQTTTGNTTVKSTKTHRGTGYRWGKNPNEIHYNFGGTGFKSKGFGQGYGQ